MNARARRDPEPTAIAAIDPAWLSKLLHDLRSPLTVLTCNRRYLEEALLKHGVDEEVREILDDDRYALQRLETAIAMIDQVVRRKP